MSPCFPGGCGVWQALDYFAGVHPRFDRAKAEGFLAKTNIRSTNKVRELSKGMVAQLHLALVMAIDAKLLVLDEPTLGLDIRYRKQFYDSLLNDYFDRSHSMEIPRAVARASDGTLEDVAAHTVVGAQTVFRAGERVRGGRILALGTGIAACAVVAIAALGVYYAGLNPTPQVVPSPSVASEVEKPLPRERPIAPDTVPTEPARAELPRLDTRAAPGSDAAAPPASLVEASVTQPVSQPPDAAPAPASPRAAPTLARSVSPAQLP